MWPWELDEVGDEEVSIRSKNESEMTDCIPALASSTPLDPQGTPSPHASLFSENIFTPSTTNRDITLSPEVYPLTDLNEPITPPSSTEIEKIEEMSEVQRNQLAIRRSTIKVPDAALAFPISEEVDDLSDLATRKQSHRSSAFESLRPSVTSLGSASMRRPSHTLASPIQTPTHRRSEISPFEEPAVPPLETAGTRVSTTSVPRVSIVRPDLSALLEKFRMTGQDHSDTNTRTKMFGPESPVEDARVTALFESVVRDILVVGVSSGVIWVALCLAVPCAGLA